MPHAQTLVSLVEPPTFVRQRFSRTAQPHSEPHCTASATGSLAFGVKDVLLSEEDAYDIRAYSVRHKDKLGDISLVNETAHVCN